MITIWNVVMRPSSIPSLSFKNLEIRVRQIGGPGNVGDNGYVLEILLVIDTYIQN
jgi:hypothetical protein